VTIHNTGIAGLMMRPRILIADDHALLREAFQKLLEADCDIVGCVGDGRALLEMAPKVKPDVILLDLAMPLLNGLDAGQQLKRMMPNVKLIVLTVQEDPDLAQEAFRIGISGFLLKSCAGTELFQAIRSVLQGTSYVTPLMEESLIEPRNRRVPRRYLTARQREVLQLLAEGYRMKQVAAILHITTRTVAFHKYRMMEDLGLKSNVELLQFAIKHRLVPGTALR
jgi:DNA-binding NarL/FixJ family response regulator